MKNNWLKRIGGALFVAVTVISVAVSSGFPANAAIRRCFEGEIYEMRIGGILSEEPGHRHIRNVGVDTEQSTAGVELLSMTEDSVNEEIVLKLRAKNAGSLRVKYERFGYGEDPEGSWEIMRNTVLVCPVLSGNAERAIFLPGVTLSDAAEDHNVKDFRSGDPDVMEILSVKNIPGGVEVKVKGVSAGDAAIEYQECSDESWYNETSELRVIAEPIEKDLTLTVGGIGIGSKASDVRVGGFDPEEIGLEKVILLDAQGNETDAAAEGKITVCCVFKAKGACYFREDSETAKEYAKKITVNGTPVKGSVGVGVGASGTPSLTYEADGTFSYLLTEYETEVKADVPPAGNRRAVLWILLSAAAVTGAAVLFFFLKKREKGD